MGVTMSNTATIKKAAASQNPGKVVKFSTVSVNRPRRKACQAVAKCVGGIASLLVFLSVWHLTCAISTLTGSNIMLAMLLAVGIDLGLIASEIGELVAHGNAVVARWARAYMFKATILSIILNTYEFAKSAPEGALTQGLAITFGILLPIMIFVLARLAAHLHQSR